MPWVYFALSGLCFFIAARTFSLGVAAVCLLLALGLLVAGALALVSRRIQTRSQGVAGVLGAEELAVIRRRAEPAVGSDAGAADAADAAAHTPDPRSHGGA